MQYAVDCPKGVFGTLTAGSSLVDPLIPYDPFLLLFD